MFTKMRNTMKFISVIIASLILCSQSIAQTNYVYEKVADGTQLILLGEGISPRNEPGKAFFFACVGEALPCASVRAVEFSSDQKSAYWKGPKLTLVSDEELASLKDPHDSAPLIHQKLSFYQKKFHRVSGRSREYVGKVLLGMFLLPFAAHAFILIVPAATLTAVVSGSLVAGGVSAIFVGSNITSMGTSKAPIQVLQSQEGWNWAERTKKVSASFYQDFNWYVMQSYPTSRGQVSHPLYR